MSDYEIKCAKDKMIFAKFNNDNRLVDGPAMQFKLIKDGLVTDLGLLERGRFIATLQMQNGKNNEFCFKQRFDSKGEINFSLPVLFSKDNSLFFGKTVNDVFEGTMYKVESGSISIQEYHSGLLIREKTLHISLPEKLTYLLEVNKLSKPDKVNKTMMEDERQYVIKTYTSFNDQKVACYRAIVEDDETTTIGELVDDAFNGVVLKQINGDVLTYRFYEDGVAQDKFQLTYSLSNKVLSYIRRIDDEHYIEFVLNDTLTIKFLNSFRHEMKGKTIVLPKDIDSAKSFEKKLSDKDNKSSKSVNPEKELNDLVGLENIKRQINRMKSYLIKNKTSNNISKSMVFTGNPGTGKTEVARLLSKILYKEGIIKKDNFVEVDRSGLVAEYVGQTEKKVQDVLEKAMGGVLFIDEAYSLYTNSDNDFGLKVIDTLVKAMEDHRDELTVIFAGYKAPMDNMIEMNPGFKSRVNRFIDFENYSSKELKDIAKLMLKKSKYKASDRVIDQVIQIVELKREDNDFANARSVRNVLEAIYEIQAERTLSDLENRTITLEDVSKYLKENNIILYKKQSKSWNVNIPTFDKTRLEGQKRDNNIENDFIKERSVNIKVYKDSNLLGEGSGSFITNDGVISTCAHVVDENDVSIKALVNIVIKDGTFITKEYDAEVISLNKKNDVALIGITNLDMVTPCYLVEENCPEIGESTHMGGYPFGGNRLKNISINHGNVQSVNSDKAIKGEEDVNRIYVDMLGQPGNSGSGVINDKGKLIGIFAGASLNFGERLTNEINYMLPTEYLFELIKSLKKEEKRYEA